MVRTLDKDTFVTMFRNYFNVPVGGALTHLRGYNTWVMDTYQAPPVGDDEKAIFLSVFIERLVDVQAPSYFDIEMLVEMSWKDRRIAKDCKGVMLGSDHASDDPCSFFWRPKLQYVEDNGGNVLLPEALMGDDQPQVIEDFGTSFMGAIKRGKSLVRMRGKFLVTMDYIDFPYDTQRFNVTFKLASADAQDGLKLTGAAKDVIPKSKPHPIWNVNHATALEDISMTRSSLNFDMQSAMAAHNITEVDAGSSILTVQIQATRKLPYYIMNYVIIQALLVGLSLLTLNFAPDATDSRLSVALSLVLAINVFQVVLVENTPETGEVTRMTYFTVLNTILLVLVGVEALMMGQAYAYCTDFDHFHSLTKRFINDIESTSSLRKLQAASRRFLLRKRIAKIVRQGRRPRGPRSLVGVSTLAGVSTWRVRSRRNLRSRHKSSAVKPKRAEESKLAKLHVPLDARVADATVADARVADARVAECSSPSAEYRGGYAQAVVGTEGDSSFNSPTQSKIRLHPDDVKLEVGPAALSEATDSPRHKVVGVAVKAMPASMPALRHSVGHVGQSAFPLCDKIESGLHERLFHPSSVNKWKQRERTVVYVRNFLKYADRVSCFVIPTLFVLYTTTLFTYTVGAGHHLS